jgi:Na+/proline symporter
MTQFNITLGAAMIVLIIAFAAAVFLISKTPATDQLETLKIRFAAVMFTGILTLFLFVAILYFGAGPDTGERAAAKEIFDKAVTAMTPLAGVILGYIFRGSQKPRSKRGSQEDLQNE